MCPHDNFPLFEEWLSSSSDIHIEHSHVSLLHGNKSKRVLLILLHKTKFSSQYSSKLMRLTEDVCVTFSCINIDGGRYGRGGGRPYTDGGLYGPGGGVVIVIVVCIVKVIAF